MTAFVTKSRNELLRLALEKLQKNTPITAVGPGAVARALAEAVTTELADFYEALDFNTSMAFVSTAQGRALDLIGVLYNIPRKTLTDIASIDQELGAFYFYIDQPYHDPIVIPAGTRVFTPNDSFVGQQLVYVTNLDVTIPIGRTRVWASIRPLTIDSIFTVGKDSLTMHTFTPPEGVLVRSTNPKPITPEKGFEADEDYRVRLTKGIRTSSGGTEEAIRFTALGVPGVRDVRVRLAPYGLGSYEVIVVADESRLNQAITFRTVESLNKVRPIGVRMFVRTPDVITVEIHANIVLRDVVNLDRAGVARRAEIAIIRYLNKLSVGQPLIYNQLIQAIFDAIDVISDVSLTRFRANASEILRRNFQVEEDQQIVPGEIRVSYT
ncbi:MAG TPA: baseplate J/gp47 family protein [Nitrososphaera sp.]|nr:baseplate J/gp47 family protein [Nitrososphaera sp.]